MAASSRNVGYDLGPRRNGTGRPFYDPADQLKLYLYGYFQRIRSSRRLEAECQRNIEVMWLINRLKLDFKTIADFRKNNKPADVTFNTTAAPAPFRYVMPRINYIIQPQDNSVVRPQNQRYFETDERRDLHSRFDTPGTRYRYQMEQLVERQRAGPFAYGSDAEPGRDISALLGMND